MSLSPQEVENLRRLLVSSDSANVELGLELLYNNIVYLKELLVPVFLFINFGSLDDDYKSQNAKQKLEKLLNRHISIKQQEQLETEIEVLLMSYRGSFANEPVFMAALANYEPVAASYEPYILQNPNYIYVYKAMATRLRKEFDHTEKAYTYYKKAIEASPDNLNYKFEFADFLLNKCFSKGYFIEEELDRVESILREGMFFYPQYKASYMHIMGTICDLYRKDKLKAKEIFYEVLKIKPDSASTLNNLANILFKTFNEKKEARRMATTAVKLESKDIHYLDTLAWIEFNGFDNIAGAEKLFRELRNYDKEETHHASMTGLGEVLEAKGDYDEALIWYKKGLKLRPQSIYKLQKMADLFYYKLEDQKEAALYYEKILTIEPTHKHAQIMLGICRKD